MTEHISTVVIGAGQAGLSTSYCLSQSEEDHIVLEQNSVLASTWHKRWDSFTLVTPNWLLQLPDFAYEGDDPEGFLKRDEVIEYIEDFAATFDPPVRLGVGVESVELASNGNGYQVTTDSSTLETSNVVVAVGTFQEPRMPAFSSHISGDIKQLHSNDYRNPESLPEGAVLVVGSAQSGCQIAEELYESGRQVYLAVGKARRVPRRYRGKDFTYWFSELGIADRTVEELPSPAARFEPNPAVSGKDGGHTLNLHQFARDGVTLLGHMEDAQGSIVRFAPDLKDSLAYTDEAAAEFKRGVDKFIDKADIEAPPVPADAGPKDGYEAPIVRELDLQAEGISTIIWATGYTFDFSWVDLPIWDEYGYPRQERGVTERPGLYFVGLHWMHTIESGLLAGVGEDAAYVVNHLVRRQAETTPLNSGEQAGVE